MLAAEQVSKRFSGIVALDRVDIEVGAGEIVGLVGPNGSGKSTLLNVLSGFARPDGGTVTMQGERIDGKRPWHIAGRGLQRTFQLPAQPQRLTVLEVMLTGARLPRGATVWGSLSPLQGTAVLRWGLVACNAEWSCCAGPAPAQVVAAPARPPAAS